MISSWQNITKYPLSKFNSVVKNKTSVTILCSNSMFTVLLDSGKQWRRRSTYF